MISKKNRLTEREVKKVLTRWKPFFSYWIVLNYQRNNLDFNRFAIVIWWKSVKNSVERNYFRRLFYDLVSDKLDVIKSYDMVFVVKKQTKLDKKEKVKKVNWLKESREVTLGCSEGREVTLGYENSIKSFKKDINFLLNKV